MTRRHYVDNAPIPTLVAPISTTDAGATVTSLVGFPTSLPFTATWDLGTSSAEVVEVTAVTGAVITAMTRNYDGQGAFAHAAGATFSHTAIAQDYDEANAHVNATAGVHGIAGNVVGDSDAQTLSNKTLTSPVINTPTLNSAVSNTPLDVGTAGTAATRSKAASGGHALETEDHTGATKLIVDESGNVSTPGTLASGAQTVTGGVTASGTVQGAVVTSTGAVNAASAAVSGNATVGGTIAVTGAASAASYTATGNVAGLEVQGAIVPATYTDQAAVAAALGTVPNGTIVRLTAPTGFGTGVNGDLFQYIGGVWSVIQPGGFWGSYTPTLTGWSIGNGTINADYVQSGQTVIFRINIVAGSTTTYSGAMSISLPVGAIAAAGEQDLFLKVYTGSHDYPAVANIGPGAATANLKVLASGEFVQMSNTSANPGTTGNLSGVLVYRSA